MSRCYRALVLAKDLPARRVADVALSGGPAGKKEGLMKAALPHWR